MARALLQSVFLVALLLMATMIVWSKAQIKNLQCTDECCYWYSAIPRNVTCSVAPYSASIPCSILTRRDPLTSVSVRWYRSDSEETAGVRGTLLTNSSKYQLLYTPAVTSIRNESVLFNDAYVLNILNFSISDFGYYWLQIVVNDTLCLRPSPYGHISENTTARDCQILLVQTLALPPVCAGSDNSESPSIGDCSSSPASTISNTQHLTLFTPSAIHSNTQSFTASTSTFSKIHSTEAASTVIFTVQTATEITPMGSCKLDIDYPTSSPSVCAFGIIGGGVFFFLILVFTVICVGVCICLRRRKRRTVQQKSENHQTERLENVQLANGLTADAASSPTETSNDAPVPAFQQQHQVSAVNIPFPVSAKNNEAHTYDSVDLESMNTSTLKSAANPESPSHTYESTPWQKPDEFNLPTSSAANNSSPAQAQYDMIGKENNSQQPLYSVIKKNIADTKKINHAEKTPQKNQMKTNLQASSSANAPSSAHAVETKPQTKAGSHQYDQVTQDDRSRSGSHAVPKPQTKAGSHQYDKVTQDNRSRSGSHAVPKLHTKLAGSHEYDEVTRSRSGSHALPLITPSQTGHVYHVLEDSSKEQNKSPATTAITDDEYSAPQTHQLVLPPNPTNNASPNGRGIVEAIGGSNPNITQSQKGTPANNTEDQEPHGIYDEPLSKSVQPEGTVTSNKPTSPMFDDPFYERGYPASTRASSKASTLPPPGKLTPGTTHNGLPEPPPRVESSQGGAPRFNNYDDATELIKKPSSTTPAAGAAVPNSGAANTSRRERDYEMTALVQCGKDGSTKGIFDDPSYETGFASRSK